MMTTQEISQRHMGDRVRVKKATSAAATVTATIPLAEAGDFNAVAILQIEVWDSLSGLPQNLRVLNGTLTGEELVQISVKDGSAGGFGIYYFPVPIVAVKGQDWYGTLIGDDFGADLLVRAFINGSTNCELVVHYAFFNYNP